jgi:hypothetical protein|tara:strand:+ start:1481 stop:2026 length:546 start_codon:yes stop_codon:yes gene_type:complete
MTKILFKTKTNLILILSILVSISCISERNNKKNTKRETVFKRPSQGSQLYSDCFGPNAYCNGTGCSQVKVKGPIDSDVLVTIKSKDFNNIVFSHAYIRSNKTYTFDLDNGTYQVFFYYGKDWDFKKIIKGSFCDLKGGFSSSEVFGKDSQQYLKNNILTYELILQRNGNFSTKESSSKEAF